MPLKRSATYGRIIRMMRSAGANAHSWIINVVQWTRKVMMEVME
jgi:hypothetical protein